MVLGILFFAAGGTLAIKYGAGRVYDKSVFLANMCMDLRKHITMEMDQDAAIHTFEMEMLLTAAGFIDILIACTGAFL